MPLKTTDHKFKANLGKSVNCFSPVAFNFPDTLGGRFLGFNKVRGFPGSHDEERGPIDIKEFVLQWI